MARITLGGIITDISGSIGGTTFSNNGSGLTAKNKVNGKRSRTTNQLISLNNSISIFNLWNSLSNAQKVVWNDYATAYTKVDRYGKTKTLNGYNWCLLINTAYYAINKSYLLAPPAHVLPDALPAFTLVLTATDIKVQFSIPVNTLTTGIQIFTTTPTRQNASYMRGAYKLINIGYTDYASEFSIRSAWEYAHKLNWSEISTGGNFNINALIYPISLSSYVTGTAQTNTQTGIAEGIGAMIIDDTFIVT
jgi:hypothetical protein